MNRDKMLSLSSSPARRSRQLMLALGVLAVLGLVLPATAQQIPALLSIPPAVAAAYPELVQWRANLVVERDALRTRTAGHNGRCSAVEEGSSNEASCQEELSNLRRAIEDHIKGSNRYNAAVSDAIAAAVAPAHPGHPFSLSNVDIRGDVYLVTANGLKISGEDAARVPLTNGARIVTGPNSRMRMTFPDGTMWTISADSDLVIDEFVYDPNLPAPTVTARLINGVLRWVDKKITEMRRREDPSYGTIYEKVLLPQGELGNRGTDFEISVAPDKSSSLKLYEGEVEYTDAKTKAKIILTAGYSLQIASDGSFGKPVPLPPSQTTSIQER